MGQTLTVRHVCLANAMRDEANPKYRVGARLPQLDAMFEAMRDEAVDIVSIKELRDCMDESGTKVILATELAMRFAQKAGMVLAACQPATHRMKPGHAFYKPFYLAQLYRPGRVMLLRGVARNTVQGVADKETVELTTLHCTYAPLRPSDRTPDVEERGFVVETVHLMPVAPEETKLRAARLLDAPATSNSVVIRIGDFNTFRDKPENGQLMACLTRDFRDITTGKLTDRSTGAPMYGTFYPFPHDRQFGPVSPPDTDAPTTSFLDYVFLSPHAADHVFHVRRVTVDRRTYAKEQALDAFDDAVIPVSDHLPLEVVLEWK